MFFDILKILFGRKTLTQKDIVSKEKLKRWQIEKRILQREQIIAEDKAGFKQKKKELSFSKRMLNILFINSFILELVVGWVTWTSFQLAYVIGSQPDLTPLVTLLGIIIGQTVSYGIYSNKAKAENTEGGLTYDLAMAEKQQEKESNDNGHAVG